MKSAEIKIWPKQGAPSDADPQPIMRPCDYGLLLILSDLEHQLGTIEAYNRVVTAAQALKRRIDVGDIKPQSPQFAKSIRG